MGNPTRNSALAASYDERAATYRTFGNGSLLDVLVEVLPPGGSVLDIGCASGGLLAGIKDHAGRRVGLEISETAAKAAREVADDVIVGDIADPELSRGVEGFDVVVLADVLEHTAEPAEALEQALRFCAPGGRVVISVPNVAHWQVRKGLLRGHWDYVESGVLDRGHLRFFTLATIVAEVTAAGLVVERVNGIIPRLRNHVPGVVRLPKRMSGAAERAWQRFGERRLPMMAFQFIVVARLPEASNAP
ncbi:MAG: Methyltransferase type 11 [Frankiales bacterium]|nr:Methyltransferase type 11 [Frankiales bacterium]